jgi:kynurenine formamidase
MNDLDPTEEEVLGYFERLSNWGRWGADDRLGTLNHITAQTRRTAASEVREGRAISLAWDIMPGLGGDPPVPPQRHMLLTGEGQHDQERVRPPGFLAVGKIGFAVEHIGMQFHGRSMTHLDALSHCFWDGRIYNDLPSASVTAFRGATAHDVRSAADGIVGRGVLLDAAALHGGPLEPGTALTARHLERIEASQGTRVEPGDILLVHTGHDERRLATANPDLPGCPGLSPSCLPWLHDRGVAALGSDGANDVDPVPYRTISRPIHAIAIVAMGLWLIDNLRLDELAAACAEDRRYTFLFQLAPLRIAGATGSPVNPIALR